MRQSRLRCLTLALAAVLLAGSLRAQEMILEPEDGLDALQSCNTVHRIATCEFFHYQTITYLGVGGLIKLDDKPYVVTWLGPGYYLDSGVVLQAVGDPSSADLVGQQWFEVYPQEGRIHVSRAWTDLDKNGALSLADHLLFDSGRELKVQDVRLNLRVKPVLVE
ncbi:MAG TPA: hypothetical protein VJ725_12525 [Thermoanaerobaculia bacterium]|nr:hypothetical protein [Thermoanaerobaculia bacterium]